MINEAILSQYQKLNYTLSLERERELIAEYIYSTNSLEGNQLTLAQTKSIIENGTISGKNIKTKDLLEQRGTYKALMFMLNAVISKEPLTVDFIKKLNWLSIGSLFQDDYYLSYKQHGQKYGDFKVKKNKIQITLSGGEKFNIEPLSTPENVELNMKTLVSQINNSEKNVVEKAAFLAQEIWLHQPFIDGNKRTARLLINFLTMKEGSPLFPYTEKGIYFNDMLIEQYVSKKSGLIQDFIINALETQIQKIISVFSNENQQQKTFKGYRFML